ncbi:hypothetical protein [Bradyrhizobium forestalis]|uniref:hypothetical protein n=1 Tax=Bradyrhizobium forestalis TaxID=1419263 RepID=UPI0011AF504B|nr:hypothetical protein [Bradyrhizobium forestalis]
MGFIDLALEIGESARLPVHSFASNRQRFGLRINSDKGHDIGIIFEACLEPLSCNCSGTLDRRHASRKYAFRRLDNNLASGNDLGLIPTHGDPGLKN